jgi:hypothetical protein
MSQVLAVMVGQLGAETVGCAGHGRQYCEVDQVPLSGPVVWDREGGGLCDQGTDHVRPSYCAACALNLDGHRFRSADRLLGAWSGQGRRSGHAPPVRGPSKSLRDEDVDRGEVTHPPVLMALRSLACCRESDADQSGGEIPERMWVGSDVEHDVTVVGGSGRGKGPLLAVQVDHLAADQAPAVRQCGGDFEQTNPALALGLREARPGRWSSFADFEEFDDAGVLTGAVVVGQVPDHQTHRRRAP